jgi:hypothetical protein
MYQFINLVFWPNLSWKNTMKIWLSHSCWSTESLLSQARKRRLGQRLSQAHYKLYLDSWVLISNIAIHFQSSTNSKLEKILNWLKSKWKSEDFRAIIRLCPQQRKMVTAEVEISTFWNDKKEKMQILVILIIVIAECGCSDNDSFENQTLDQVTVTLKEN